MSETETNTNEIKLKIEALLSRAEKLLAQATKLAEDHHVQFDWYIFDDCFHYYPEGYVPQTDAEEYMESQLCGLEGWVSSSSTC